MACLANILGENYALAQIIPDNTLGTEASTITPDVNLNGLPADLINGGATRGINLFHSFLEFNIDNGGRVYFASPVGIDNILTRVTGGNPSQILGTLGVDGVANLFLLNPKGMIFGENARLDIPGSFFASTADSLLFDDGTEFSATKPEAPPLLTINVPVGVQYGRNQPAAIVNAGKLAVGQDLGLVAGTIVNTGQLSAPEGQIVIVATGTAEDTATVPSTGTSIGSPALLSELLLAAGGGKNLGLRVTESGNVELTESGLAVAPGDIVIAGGKDFASVLGRTATLAAAHNLTFVESQLAIAGNLNLLAQDTVRVRDTVASRVNAQVGGNLYVQGIRGIDILALNHPGNAFESGGNLSLVSDGIISGDAHFASGGRFSILDLSGNPGNFVSLYDPIISSVGDVVLGNYAGVSLKVESMGSITTGNITITGPDTTLIYDSDPDIKILRDSPALILRAGVDKLENPPTPPNPTTPINPSTPTNPSIVIPSTSVYSNNFEGTVGSEWSNTKTDVTPVGNRRFLGQFGSETVNLTLDNLPSHTESTVSFDLFLIRTWDGNNSDTGPDNWNLSVGDGTTLLNSTFSTHDFPLGDRSGYPQTQSYPANYNPSSLVNNPARIGAAENNTLGYTYYFDDLEQERQIDSVYRLSVTFPHIDNSLQLKFSGSLTEGLDDESWGIDNVKVSVATSLTSPGVPLPPRIPNPPTFTSSRRPSAGSITAGNLSTPGGPIILSATDDITLKGSMSSGGGNINLDSGGNINTTNSLIVSGGGNINLDSSGNINTATSSIASGGGNINLDSSDNINTTNSSIVSGGGNISLDSSDNIDTTTARLDSFSVNNGGAISLIAEGDIKAGDIRSSGEEAGGNITLQSGGGIFMDGNRIIRSDTFGSSRGGDINITAQSVLFTNGARVLTGTLNDGVGGNLNVTADVVELVGTSSDGQNVSILSTANGGNQPAGNLMINTGRLIVRDGAGISVSTAGAGKGGDLIVNASESVELIGTSATGFPSGLSADTTGEGNAGNLIINTRRFAAQDGAVASVSTFGEGRGGNLTVNASESIELSGTASNGFASGLYAQAFSDGDAGNLTINTQDLIVRDQAKVTVAADTAADSRVPNPPSFNIGTAIVSFDPDATGTAGNIEVNADNILLDNQGKIIAQTDSTEGGNITLNVAQLLLLRHNSQISATAGTAQAGGNGGNITINSPLIVAFPTENSDITANAFLGNGGNIQITTQGILGLEIRPKLTFRNDITAISELGLVGIANIDKPDIDPVRELAELPTEIGPRKVYIGCHGASQAPVEFVSIGRGGKPPSPREPLNNNAGWVDSRAIALGINNPSDAATVSQPPYSQQIVEAQGWIVHPDGLVELVAEMPTPTAYNSWSEPVSCN
ncbi:MAG: filamentous hemagglutinin N-terminal domain-containing protein [Symploca sp. SIO3E6]|nr:filamentous hemagglutinin N-terminal domain-containing protein [Caldora sp. SIO3E6]